MPQNDCKKYSDMIYEYTADMLSAEKERDLMRHIESCSSCRNELERIRAVMGAASEIEDVPVPDELISALDTRLEQTGREIRNSRRQGYGNITGTVLSLAAAAALAIGMYSGGVFDKYLHSDDIFNNDTNYTDSQNAAQTEKSDADYGDVPSTDNPNISPDAANNASGGAGQSDNSNNSDKSSESGKSTASKKNEKSDSSTGVSQTEKSSDGKIKNNTKSENRGSSSAGNAANTDESHSALSDAQSDNGDSNSVSEKAADEIYAENTVPESLDEGRGGADDFEASASSAENSERSSGGANPYDANGQDGLRKQQSPPQVYSVNASSDTLASGTKISIPSSCEIVTANPKIYRDIYNVGSNGKFSISASEWPEFEQFVTNNGDTLIVGAKTTSDPNAYISVRITAK